MVLIQPSVSDLDELRKTSPYEVLQRDQTAHVVYDKKTNEVLIGASVIEVGSSNGTITDIDGQYSIKLSNSDKKILQASYLGYVVKQERVGNRKVVNFFLEEDQVTISNK